MGPHVRRENALLSRIPSNDFPRLEPLLRPARLVQGQVLCETGDVLRDVWFPTSAMVSMCAATSDGGSVEVGTIGPEGAVGVCGVLGDHPSVHQAVVLMNGDALRMDVDEFRRWCKLSPELNECVLAYIQALLSQATQAAACSRFHSAEQRLARWLLETADRAAVQSFPLTQETLALLLGMRRPWLTQTAQRLQDRGLIRSQRGDIEIVNRPELERTACECYGIVRQHFAAFLERCCPKIAASSCRDVRTSE
jgi:CRP-like cAMP-binding protein